MHQLLLLLLMPLLLLCRLSGRARRGHDGPRQGAAVVPREREGCGVAQQLLLLVLHLHSLGAQLAEWVIVVAVSRRNSSRRVRRCALLLLLLL